MRNLWYDTVGRPLNVEEWATMFESHDRRIANTHVGRFWVSTVFLGLDHRFDEGPPLIYETMVFDTKNDHPMLDVFQERYTTATQARHGHERAVQKYRRPWRKVRDES